GPSSRAVSSFQSEPDGGNPQLPARVGGFVASWLRRLAECTRLEHDNHQNPGQVSFTIDCPPCRRNASSNCGMFTPRPVDAALARRMGMGNGIRPQILGPV